MSLGHGSQIVKDGLVLHLDAANVKSYPGSGTVWKDLSGLGNHCTLNNAPVFSTTNAGTFSFNGINTSVTCSSSSIRSLVNNFSTEIWYTSTNFSPYLAYQSPAGYTLARYNEGTQWKVTKYSIVDIYIGTIPLNSSWHQAVVTYSNSTGTSIYVDGMLQSTSININNLSATASNVLFGVAESGYHLGNISNVRTYNKVLSASEIRHNFEATRGRYGI